MKKVLYIIEDIIFIILLLCLCWIVYSVYKYDSVSFFDYHFMRIVSNSMEPTFDVNTCIIVKKVKEDELVVGDIITFRSEEVAIYGSYNTHGIYDIYVEEETGTKKYITKGDLFEIPDRLRLEYSDILGKYQREVPYSDKISFLMEKLSNNVVYFFSIIFPLVLCLLSYIYQIIHLIIFGVEDDIVSENQECINQEVENHEHENQEPVEIEGLENESE